MKHRTTILVVFMVLIYEASHAQNTVLFHSGFLSGAGVVSGGGSSLITAVGEPLVGNATGPQARVSSGLLGAVHAATIVTNVEEAGAIPLTFALYQNYPNPFNPMTTIAYDLPSASHVTVRVFNLLGQLVSTVVNDEQPAGRYRVVWPGSNDRTSRFSSGVYFYRIHAKETGGERKEFVQTKKLLLLR